METPKFSIKPDNALLAKRRAKKRVTDESMAPLKKRLTMDFNGEINFYAIVFAAVLCANVSQIYARL